MIIVVIFFILRHLLTPDGCVHTAAVWPRLPKTIGSAAPVLHLLGAVSRQSAFSSSYGLGRWRRISLRLRTFDASTSSIFPVYETVIRTDRNLAAPLSKRISRYLLLC